MITADINTLYKQPHFSWQVISNSLIGQITHADGESHLGGGSPRKVSIVSQPAEYTADPATHYAGYHIAC